MQADIETPMALSTKLDKQLEEPTETETPAAELQETTTTEALTPGAAGTADYAEELSQHDNDGDGDGKNKTRRYWSTSDEERFLEIWGRENWRLTRHGKNTVYFAKWAEELRSRYEIEVKPEDIQAKVNQTRAKFRQVKKTMQVEGSAARWKKYAIIDSILKNQYRPKDAEPIPKEALERNRDMTPPPSGKHKTTMPQDGVDMPALAKHEQLSMDNSESSEHNLSGGGGYFNTANDTQSRLGITASELFTDQYDDIKQEFDEPEYGAQTYHPRQAQPQPAAQSTPSAPQQVSYAPADDAELLELQTPLQLQQQQHQHHQHHHQQQQQQQYPNQYTTASTTHAYEQHTPNAYADQSTVMSMHANSTEYNNIKSAASTPTSTLPVDYVPQQSHNAHSNSLTTLNGSMQPPRPTGSSNTSRKRGRPVGSMGVAAVDSLEITYIEEIRRKNQILEDQLQISRRRLELEERKVSLMSQYFPKYLEQQAQIIAKLPPHSE